MPFSSLVESAAVVPAGRAGGRAAGPRAKQLRGSDGVALPCCRLTAWASSRLRRTKLTGEKPSCRVFPLRAGGTGFLAGVRGGWAPAGPRGEGFVLVLFS